MGQRPTLPRYEKEPCTECGANEWVDMKCHYGRYTYPRCANCMRLTRRRKAATPEGREQTRNRSRATYVRACHKYLLGSAKRRAKEFGLEFDLTPYDITIPERCPLLDIPIRIGKGVQGPNSPSLDRIDSNLGYVRGNVWVVSYRANAIKRDATLDELRRIVSNLEKRLSEPVPETKDPRRDERLRYGDDVCRKLTSEQIQQVLNLRGLPIRKLAASFKVTTATIYQVLHPQSMDAAT